MNIIEIGADNGSDTLVYSRYANVWCFEPVPTSIQYLNKIFKDVPNVKVIGKAVSDFNGRALFNLSKYNRNSSSLNELSEFSISNKLIEYESQVIVDVIRMDTFMDENKIDVIDFFHCDAQGNDLKILKSFGDKISSIKQGKVEVTLRENLYKNIDNDVTTMVEFLSSNGFIISNLKELLNTKWYDGNIIFYKKPKTIYLI